MWWDVTDLAEWVQLAVDARSKYVRHAVDPRFKTRVLSSKAASSVEPADAPVCDGSEVYAIPSTLLLETYRDLVRRMGADAVAAKGLPPRVAIVVRDFPFAHAPDLAVLIDPRLPPDHFYALHNRACVAVATSLALLKSRLDKRADKRSSPAKRSGVIVQGRAGGRFVETPFLPHAPTVQLLLSDVYLTHHQPVFERGTKEQASFDLFRVRVAQASRPDKQGLDVVVYHGGDQELHRLYPKIPDHTEATSVPRLSRWTHAHLLREMHTALNHPGATEGYMEYKWKRLHAHERGGSHSPLDPPAAPARDLSG